MAKEPLLYQLSPAIATTTSAVVAAWIAALVSDSKYIFATWSNFCFVFAGLYAEFRAFRKRGSVELIGGLATPTVPFLLLGASSLAFHRDSEVSSNAHTLDIFLGWVLVGHVALVTSTVALVSFAPERAVQFLRRYAMSIGTTVLIVCLASFYDIVYENQRLFYLVAGAVAMTTSALCRLLLVYDNYQLKRTPVVMAILELVAGAWIVVAAIFSQGELLGRRVSLASDEARYDLYHSNWHYLLALVASCGYTRADDAARRVVGWLDESTDLPCLCAWPRLDAVGAGVVVIHAVLVVALKELEVDITLVRGLLTASTLLMATHAGFFFVAYLGNDGAIFTAQASKKRARVKPDTSIASLPLVKF